MKMKSTFIAATLLLVSVMTEGGLSAQNPIVQTCYTSDPAPMVHDGTLYVYTGHDEDKADFFWILRSSLMMTVVLICIGEIRISIMQN